MLSVKEETVLSQLFGVLAHYKKGVDRNRERKPMNNSVRNF